MILRRDDQPPHNQDYQADKVQERDDRNLSRLCMVALSPAVDARHYDRDHNLPDRLRRTRPPYSCPAALDREIAAPRSNRPPAQPAGWLNVSAAWTAFCPRRCTAA